MIVHLQRFFKIVQITQYNTLKLNQIKIILNY